MILVPARWSRSKWGDWYLHANGSNLSCGRVIRMKDGTWDAYHAGSHPTLRAAKAAVLKALKARRTP